MKYYIDVNNKQGNQIGEFELEATTREEAEAKTNEILKADYLNGAWASVMSDDDFSF